MGGGVTTGGRASVSDGGESGLRPLPTAPDQRVGSQERLVPQICAAGGDGGRRGHRVRGQTAQEQTDSTVHEQNQNKKQDESGVY